MSHQSITNTQVHVGNLAYACLTVNFQATAFHLTPTVLQSDLNAHALCMPLASTPDSSYSLQFDFLLTQHR